MDFVGEGCIQKESASMPAKRGATVTAQGDLRVLSLGRSQLIKLREADILTEEVMDKVLIIREKRTRSFATIR